MPISMYAIISSHCLRQHGKNKLQCMYVFAYVCFRISGLVSYTVREREVGTGKGKGKIVQGSEVKISNSCLVTELLELHVPQFLV